MYRYANIKNKKRREEYKMKLEHILKWKHGSFEDYENIINEQEKLLKQIKKLNLEIEKTEDARSCFDYKNSNEIEKWTQYNNEIKQLLKEKERIGLRIKQNNERISREFY